MDFARNHAWHSPTLLLTLEIQMNWLSKLWLLFKSYFIPCAQTATDAAEDAGVISKETADEIEEVIEGLGALDKIVSRSLELIGGGLPENSLLPPDNEDGVQSDQPDDVRTETPSIPSVRGSGSVDETPVEPEQPKGDQPNS